jgi:hypothetical protein
LARRIELWGLVPGRFLEVETSELFGEEGIVDDTSLPMTNLESLAVFLKGLGP